MIDLRSDTVTRPSPGMRSAMASAEVGDDVFGEDPTVRALEERVAATLGKPSALFVPSGTMANQIALMLHTRPGDEVVVTEGAHCAWYECGAGAALGGVQFVVGAPNGILSPEALDAAIKPNTYYYPRTSLLALENTHNRGGGRVLPQPEFDALAEHARARGLAVHLDGARLMNASIASGLAPSELSRLADTVSLCLSKGLGAPVGSLLAGSRPHIQSALRLRKMLGGGMRQAGVLAAAGLWALEHNVARLADDHANARAFAEALGQCPTLRVSAPETNIVMIDLSGEGLWRPAERFAARARDLGVLLSVFGSSRLRAVTHLDVSRADCLRAAEVVASIAASA